MTTCALVYSDPFVGDQRACTRTRTRAALAFKRLLLASTVYSRTPPARLGLRPRAFRCAFEQFCDFVVDTHMSRLGLDRNRLDESHLAHPLLSSGASLSFYLSGSLRVEARRRLHPSPGSNLMLGL